MITTFLASSVNSSPKGSAVWTLAAGGGAAGRRCLFRRWGRSAPPTWLAAGGGDSGAADGAGAGVADGLAAGEAEGAGDCASAAPPSAIATTGSSATKAARKVLIRFIAGILHPTQGPRHLALAACPGPRLPEWRNFS